MIVGAVGGVGGVEAARAVGAGPDDVPADEDDPELAVPVDVVTGAEGVVVAGSLAVDGAAGVSGVAGVAGVAGVDGAGCGAGSRPSGVGLTGEGGDAGRTAGVTPVGSSGSGAAGFGSGSAAGGSCAGATSICALPPIAAGTARPGVAGVMSSGAAGVTPEGASTGVTTRPPVGRVRTTPPNGLNRSTGSDPEPTYVDRGGERCCRRLERRRSLPCPRRGSAAGSRCRDLGRRNRSLGGGAGCAESVAPRSPRSSSMAVLPASAVLQK